jgi:prepilin peptidase CpaA
MTTSLPQLILLAALAGLLLWAAVGDIRRYIIPNRLCLIIAGLAPLYWWASSGGNWPTLKLLLLWQLGIGTAIFILGAVLFALNVWGGGDVKLLAALALWTPAADLAKVMFIMALCGAVIALGWLAAAKWRARQNETNSSGPIEIPYGVAIAAGGLTFAGQPFLKVFGA